ncbi:alpha/beta-hydrolase [Mytilinidion resinicola]|uniref:Carboxypeptidase n=1 Tax=Mytilinidion resinicola TaxID=574789 RepID=A0A6A6Y4C4_9PEZI|nr:alpha/beta-hydrolase [Mytilinidion resinicola]KAF2803373.1 alpha/beta-hydrolase [Mytilinidion resinicola]
MRFSLACVATLFCASTAIAGSTPHGFGAFNKVRSPTIEKREPGQPFHNAKLQKRASRWLTEKTKEFAVNGTGIPDVPFDIGESYAGLLPISDDPNETRELFFWFFPSTNPNPGEEITIWFNGGPGCSSLSGLLTENGPFVWDAGTLAPTPNPYTWVNLTNMVWVEQPVGVGFTQGTPNITNEVELGLEFIGFYKQFVDTFDVHKWKVYLTGESYAGFYVPYIADAFITADDTDYYNLAGVGINDPIIGDETNQQQVVQLAFVEYWNNLFYLNETFLDEMRAHNEFCNYTQYQEKYLTFPPPQEPFPVLPDPYASEDYTCDQFDNFYSAIIAVNPCYNIYHITETCPHPYSVLGIVNTGDYSPPGATVYFNRTDVQKAIHAPVGTNWMQCTDVNVFGDGENNNQSRSDQSLGPAQNGVLARVIDYTNNTIIGSGNLDMLLNTNGTLLAIQNMTWGGKQGLQEYPGTPLYAPYHPETNLGFPTGAGELGFWGSERGLTFYQTQLAGHELPEYAPGVAYRMLEILLGRIENFSVVSDFTTQSGNYTGNSTIYRRSMEMPSYFQ